MIDHGRTQERILIVFTWIHLSKDIYPKKQIERDRIKKPPL
jgi:hypothetical protein